jgi:hypothetical protein
LNPSSKRILRSQTEFKTEKKKIGGGGSGKFEFRGSFVKLVFSS